MHFEFAFFYFVLIHLELKGQVHGRLFTVVYFSVRSSRSRALRYGLPILHECQNYLGGGGGLGESEKNRRTVITSLQLAFRRRDRNFTP